LQPKSGEFFFPPNFSEVASTFRLPSRLLANLFGVASRRAGGTYPSDNPQTEGGFPSAVIRKTGRVLLSIASGGVWTRRSCAKTGSPISITEMRTTVPDCDSRRNHFIAALKRTLLRSAQRILPPEPNSRPKRKPSSET